MYWGMSEALDLYDEYQKAFKTKSNVKETADENASVPNEINILLYGGGDPRHIIKTMAKLHTHRGAAGDNCAINLKVKFYVVEGFVEVIARFIALLSIALENANSLSLISRTHIFMDLYGNSLLRTITEQYLISKCQTLANMLSNTKQQQRLAPFIGLQHFKSHERQKLADVFNFWLPKKAHTFDISSYWTAGVRKLLGDRYDERLNAFHWDLNMTLRERGAEQICAKEYSQWRETGIAFSFPQYEQHVPNKTLALSLVRNGKYYAHRGCTDELQTGPYCTFGLQTSSYSKHIISATNTTERSLQELFYELLKCRQCTNQQDLWHLSFKKSIVKMPKKCDMQIYNKPWLRIKGVQIEFLPMHNLLSMAQECSARWHDFFDVIFVAQNYFPLISDHFAKLLRPNGLLLLETKLYCMQAKQRVRDFTQQQREFAERNQLQPLINCNGRHTLLKYKKIWRPSND